MYDNVQLWFAKNKDGNILTIDEVNKNTKDKYYCPMCGSELVPRQGKINSWCFAHIDKSKCSSESMIHFWVKNKLIEKGDRFIVKSDIEKQYVCKDILVEESWEVDGKIYRPDLTIITECEQTIYFEMNHTNKKKLEDYIDTWIGLNNIVVEVDTKTLINSQIKKLPIFNALWYEGKCFNVEDNTYYKTIGCFKEKLLALNEYKENKKEVQKLDWLWNDIIRFKKQEVDIQYLSNLIQSIEYRKAKDIVIDILKKCNCNNIVKDYVEFNKGITISKIQGMINEVIRDQEIKSNIKIRFNQPREIYERIYSYFRYFSIGYKNKYINIGNSNSVNKEYLISFINSEINKLVNEYRCETLQNNEELNHVIKYLSSKHKEYCFDKTYCSFYSTHAPELIVKKSQNQILKIDLSPNEILYSNDKKYIRNYIKNKIKEFESNAIEIRNTDELVKILDDLKARYKKINPKNEITYELKCNNEINIKFTRNNKVFIYDYYLILNNKLLFDGKYYSDLVYDDNGNVDCNILNTQLIEKMASRLREEMYK